MGFSGSSSGPSGPAGGGLTGTYPNPGLLALNLIASTYPAVGAITANSQKITNQANGVLSNDAASFGQLPAIWGAVDQGLIAWNVDPGGSTGSSIPLPTAGQMVVQAVKLPIAQNITNIILILQTNGATLTAGQCFCALYQGVGGSLLGATADQAANWGAGAIKSIVAPISGGPVAAAAGILYVGFWFNGTTGPAFMRMNGNAAEQNVGLVATSSRWGIANTGLTTAAPGTLGAISAAPTAYWVGLS